MFCIHTSDVERMADKGTELMHGQIVKKDPARLRLKPNLQGFEQLRKTFKWSDADKMVEWFPGGKINAAYNVIDRHANGTRKDKIALIFDDGQGNAQEYTFKQLGDMTSKFANVMTKLGIKRQDRVFFFLQRSPQLYAGFLGAIKGVASARAIVPR